MNKGQVLALVGESGCGKRELNIAMAGSPETIDPQLVSDSLSAEVTAFFSSTLYIYDQYRELVPGLAESCDVSTDGCTYTFHLRDGLRWSNGSPLTSDDFVFALQRLADPATGSETIYIITDCCSIKNAAEINSGKLPISELGVSAPDNRTFVIELNEPCPYLKALTTHTSMTPTSRAFFNSCGNSYATSAETILSCGPYDLDRYEPLASQIHLVKNPDYYDADSVKADALNLQVVSNVQQGMMCYQAGSIDIVNIKGELAELAVDDPHLQNFSTAAMYFLDINHRSNENLQNKNIRMALAKAIDRESIVKNVLRTGFDSLTRINPPGYYQDTNGNDFAGDEDNYDEYLGYDPERAGEYWNKGIGELGVSSISLELMYLSSQQNMIEAVADQMKKNLPGLDLKLKPVSSKVWGSARGNGGYDLLFYGWIADYADPTSFYMLFVSGAGAEGYDNPDFDRLFLDSGSEGDTSKRNEMLHEMEDILCKDVAAIPLFSGAESFLVADGVSGMQLYPTGAVVVPVGFEKEVK